MRNQNKPELVIAGPGAGKTYNMINKIVEAMPNLEPHRFLVASTYTNAATESILSQLHKIAQIPPNVFIGTNYSFFNKFILIPFATLFEHTALDKLFLELDVGRIVDDIIEKQYGKQEEVDFCLQAGIRSNIMTKFLKNGTIPFEQIARISASLLKNKPVRGVVANRIQFLFVDEFQDTDRTQFEIFDQIRKAGKTKIYVVGDPEQYISGFTYKGVQRPSFETIPFNKFSKSAEVRKNDSNRRSYAEIVNFLNHFHTEMNQNSTKGNNKHAGVYFINNTDMGAIISHYKRLTDNVKTRNRQVIRFYLGKENKMFEGYITQHNLVPASNDRVGTRGLLDETLNLLAIVVGLNQRQILEKYELDRVGYRQLGVRLIEAINDNKIKDEESLKYFVQSQLQLKIEQQNSIKIDRALSKIKNLFIQNDSSDGQHLFSSIHKAKGLQADTVLAVAKSENELKKWLNTDKAMRYKDKNDDCRVGYVAFSRAKQILCIACLKPVNDKTTRKMKRLGVQIVGNPTQIAMDFVY